MSVLASWFNGHSSGASADRSAPETSHTDARGAISLGNLAGWRRFLDARGAIAALSIAAVAINTIIVVITARSHVASAHNQAVAANTDTVIGFEQYALSLIAHAETTSRVVAQEYLRAGAAVPLAELRASGVIDPAMYAAAHIIDEQGNVIASSDARETLARPFREISAEAAAVHLSGEPNRVHLGKPFQDRETRQPIIPMISRPADANGGGAGFIVIEVPASRFTDFRAQAPNAGDDVLALIGTDGIARARRIGHVSTAGEDFSRGPLFAGFRSETSGNLLAASPVDGERRLFSFRSLKDYPLIVAAGTSEEAAIGQASRTAKWYYVRAGVLTVIVVLLSSGVIAALTRRKSAVAQLRASETALRAREGELRTLTESMPQLVWIAGADGRLTFLNRQWQEFTGLSEEDCLEGHWKKALHPDDEPTVSERWQQCVARGEVFETEYRLRSADGVYHWMLGRAVPIRDGDGRPTKWFGTATDIDSQIAAQEQVRKQAELLNLTDDAIIVREISDTIRFWNRGAEKLYGWTADEVIGRKSRDFGYEDVGDVVAAKAAVEEHGQWSGEMKQMTRDGDKVIVTSRWTSVPGDHGESKSILIVNRDITERKESQQQLLRADRLESIGTLASGVAHDLNNVLAPVLLAAPLLRKDLPAERRDRLVSLIEQSAERGSAIVMQVLTFARGADGEHVLLQPVHLLKHMVNLVHETFPKTIEVNAVYPEDVWLIEGDSTQLHQVLLNLCVNARDAMPEGGILKLTAQNFDVDENYASMTPGAKPGPYVLLEVSDTGTGIPQHVIDKIYDPFFTTKGIGKGTGLGLSTVLGIIRSHSGVINVSSSADGTTFRVLLPAAVHDGHVASASDVQDLPQGNGETILMVDDEPAVLEIAETLLVNNGYKVLTAEDGPTALAIFADHLQHIDLVLTDLAMPIMSGIALARTLRRMDGNVRIVISTGREDDFTRAELDEIGIKATLPKPYSQPALLGLLHQVLHAEDLATKL